MKAVLACVYFFIEVLSPLEVSGTMICLLLFSFFASIDTPFYHVYNDHLYSDHAQFSDEKLKEALEKHPSVEKIQWIDIRAGLNDEALCLIAEKCSDLRDLELNAEHFTDAGLEYLASKCKKLEKISLYSSGNGNLTDKSLMALGQYCSSLFDVSLQGQPKISDVGLTALAKGCPELAFLEVSASKDHPGSITSKGLEGLASFSKELCEVNLPFQNVSVEGVEILMNKCPHLEVVGSTSLNRADLDKSPFSKDVSVIWGEEQTLFRKK